MHVLKVTPLSCALTHSLQVITVISKFDGGGIYLDELLLK